MMRVKGRVTDASFETRRMAKIKYNNTSTQKKHSSVKCWDTDLVLVRQRYIVALQPINALLKIFQDCGHLYKHPIT